MCAHVSPVERFSKLWDGRQWLFGLRPSLDHCLSSALRSSRESIGLPFRSPTSACRLIIRPRPPWPMSCVSLRPVPMNTSRRNTHSRLSRLLNEWGRALLRSPHDHRVLSEWLDSSIEASSFSVATETKLRSSFGIDTRKRTFDGNLIAGRMIG
jgi:hypothetical protein